MPRTRSMQTGAIIKTMLDSDSTFLDPPDTLCSPPLASFGGHLAKYQYANESAREKRTSSSTDASSKRPAKRSRSAPLIKPEITPSSLRPSKKPRQSSKYADPSKYAHLSPLVDILSPNLICVFVGTNPGVSTARQGHAYAHPSNLFWKLLHSSGLTDRRLAPSEDRTLPVRYCMGNTNIVERPSKDAAELSRDEMTEGTRRLEAKIAEFRPEAVCIVGKGIWEAIWRFWHGRSIRKGEFRYGWQDEGLRMGIVLEEGWMGSRVFVATSTSGLAASLKPAEKEAIWRPFGEWVMRRRAERGFVPGEVGEALADRVKVEEITKKKKELDL